MTDKEQNTKEKILDASEELMARQGYKATSIRDITKKAGLHVGSINYHFSSKEKLFHAVCARKISIINNERLAGLKALEAGSEKPQLEQVLEAFLKPAITFECDKKDSFMKLMARLYVEPGDHWLPVYGMFEEVITVFTLALKKSLPELSDEDHLWCFHFMIGVMCQTLLNPEQIEILSHGKVSSKDGSRILKEMIAFVAAGYRKKQ